MFPLQLEQHYTQNPSSNLPVWRVKPSLINNSGCTFTGQLWQLLFIQLPILHTNSWAYLLIYYVSSRYFILLLCNVCTYLVRANILDSLDTLLKLQNYLTFLGMRAGSQMILFIAIMCGSVGGMIVASILKLLDNIVKVRGN